MLKLIISCLLATSVLSGQCPPKDAPKCKCRGITDEISCHFSYTELPAVLKNISARIKNKHFKSLDIHLTNQNPSSTAELSANFTADLTFDSISITKEVAGSNRPFRIHRDAFKTLANRLHHLIIKSSNSDRPLDVKTFPEPSNIFSVINTLNQIEFLHISGVSSIPKQAFRQLNRLKTLGLEVVDNRNPIGQDAFYQLKNLESIDLSVKSITTGALHFQKSNVVLEVDLRFNRLTESSFSNQSLIQFNRPTLLNLANNQLKFIPEHIFKPFLDVDRNEIVNLRYNQLNCSDCRNAWLGKRQDKYKKRVRQAICDRGLEGDTVFDGKYQHCK